MKQFIDQLHPTRALQFTREGLTFEMGDQFLPGRRSGALLAIFICSLAILACEEEGLPEVITLSTNHVTTSSVEVIASIVGDGGVGITERGVCWSTESQPTIANERTSDGTSAGPFTSRIEGLSPGVEYFVRAYATNKVGIAYGNEITFETLRALAQLATAPVEQIQVTTAVSGGTIGNTGGGTITAVGVCWVENWSNPPSNSPPPTVENSTKTIQQPDGNSFISTLTDLSPGTRYQVRAYVTSEVGTSYGEALIFETKATLPTIATAPVSAVTSNSAATGGNVIKQGGHVATERGVCWGTQPQPTISGSKTLNGSGAGSFTSTLSGLAPGTQYYVRAYATNSVGTAYGEELTFTTLATLPTVTTSPVTNIASNSVTAGGNVTQNGGASITERGVCWSTSTGPTTANQKQPAGTGSGVFTIDIGGLLSGTEFFLRAYATNSVGTSYGLELTFTTNSSTIGSSVTDIDGNVYAIVTIGNQKWTKTNLTTTRYRDGSTITTDLTTAQWTAVAAGAYAVFTNFTFNNPTSNNAIYGKLYNGYAVTDSRGLCPTGTHAPTEAEWQVLINHVGGTSVAGRELKEAGDAHWGNFLSQPNTGANDTYGFAALPGGYRTDLGYMEMQITGTWFSVLAAGGVGSISINVSSSAVWPSVTDLTLGASVRCIAD